MTDDLLDAPVSPLSAREKRDLQKAQLRPLANRRPELYEEDEYTSDEYEQMMDMYNGTLASIEEGEIVKSVVLEVRENMVVLDIGFKSEGTIPLEEFKDMPDLKAGDEVEVLLEHLEDQEGSVVLSKKKADFMRVWERIRVAYESDQPVEGTLVKKIKGGVVVDLMGVDAFLPGSQIALRRVPNIDELLGQRYEMIEGYVGPVSNAVVIAAGAHWEKTGETPARPDRETIPGIESPAVKDAGTAVKAALADPKALGGRVLIVDDGSGYVPFGLAELLADNGVGVEVISPQLLLGEDLLKSLDMPHVFPRIVAKGVKLSPQTFIDQIEGSSVTYGFIWGGPRTTAEFDTVVVAMHKAPNDALWHALKGRVAELHRIGDCVAPRKPAAVIYEAEKLAREI